MDLNFCVTLLIEDTINDKRFPRWCKGFYRMFASCRWCTILLHKNKLCMITLKIRRINCSEDFIIA